MFFVPFHYSGRCSFCYREEAEDANVTSVDGEVDVVAAGPDAAATAEHEAGGGDGAAPGGPPSLGAAHGERCQARPRYW